MIADTLTPIAVIGWLMPQAVRGPLLLQWFEAERARRQLERCQILDPRFASDVGITAAEIAVECAAPPWRPIRLARAAEPR